jgi:hypothetical protein
VNGQCHHGRVLVDHDFHPDEPTVRIFRVPPPGVLRLDDGAAISEAVHDGVVRRPRRRRGRSNDWLGLGDPGPDFVGHGRQPGHQAGVLGPPGECHRAWWLAGVLASGALAGFQPGDEALTFGEFPVSLAAGLAALEVLRRDGLLQACADMGRYASRALHQMKARHQGPRTHPQPLPPR